MKRLALGQYQKVVKYGVILNKNLNKMKKLIEQLENEIKLPKTKKSRIMEEKELLEKFVDNDGFLDLEKLLQDNDGFEYVKQKYKEGGYPTWESYEDWENSVKNGISFSYDIGDSAPKGMKEFAEKLTQLLSNGNFAEAKQLVKKEHPNKKQLKK